MKLLITGASGLLGQYLNIELSRRNKILPLYNSNLGNSGNYKAHKINLINNEDLQKVFEDFRPDAVIHTAAISRPETASSLPIEEVYKINVEVTGNIAKLCDKYLSKLIYTSTDLVYDGECSPFHKEDETPKPISLYAETKLLGEFKIKEVFDNYIILRTSLLYGKGLTHSTNNFHKMLLSLQEGNPVKLFYDQFRTPLSLKDAARLINKLINIVDLKNETLNFGGIERVSRLQLGEILCEEGKFDKSLLVSTSMYDVPGLPPVADASMDTSKLQSFGLFPSTIINSVKEILSTLD